MEEKDRVVFETSKFYKGELKDLYDKMMNDPDSKERRGSAFHLYWILFEELEEEEGEFWDEEAKTLASPLRKVWLWSLKEMLRRNEIAWESVISILWRMRDDPISFGGETAKDLVDVYGTGLKVFECYRKVEPYRDQIWYVTLKEKYDNALAQLKAEEEKERN